MKILKNITPLAAASTVAVSALLTPLLTQAETTGNISVVSAYVLRGNTNSMENSGTAVQGGIDWSHKSGVYLGYWGSNLDYISDEPIPEFDSEGNVTGTAGYCEKPGDCPSQGFENDFYGGWAGSTGDWGYGAGLIYYYYIGVKQSDVFEIVANGAWKDLTLEAKYLTGDVIWGNSGDIYWTLDYGLSDVGGTKFSLDFLLGYYTYTKDGKYVPPKIVVDGSTKDAKSSAFRHLNIALSHPIANTGADWTLTAILGGDDRYGQDLANTVTLGVSYDFGITE